MSLGVGITYPPPLVTEGKMLEAAIKQAVQAATAFLSIFLAVMIHQIFDEIRSRR